MSKVSKAQITAGLMEDQRLQALRDGGIPQSGFPGRSYTDTVYNGTTDGDTGGLGEYWHMLKRRKGTLLLAAALGLAAAFLLTRMQSPSYRARTLIEIENLNENFLNTGNVSPTATEERSQSPDYTIRTQTLILQSRPVLERALSRLDLGSRLLVRKPPSPVLSWAPASTALSQLSSTVTTVLAWVKPPAPAQESPVPQRKDLAPQRKAPRGRDITPRGKDLATAPGKDLTAPGKDLTVQGKDLVPPLEQALRLAEAGLRVRPQPSTRVIEVTFASVDPQVAADFANSLIGSFTELSLERRRQASQSTGKWLNQQLTDVKATLEHAEDTLQRYASGSDAAFISEKDNAAEERLRQVQVQLLKAQEDRVAKQSLYELAAMAPAESLPEVLDDATLKEYQVQLTTLRRQMADLTTSFTDEYPKVSNVRAQIAAIEAALEKKRGDIVSRIRNEYTAASRREKLLSADYAAQAAVVSKEAPRAAHYSVLKREVETNRQLYDSMLQRVGEAGLASAMRASDIRVVEPATPPRLPYTPNVVLNGAFGLFSGTIWGVALIVWRARSYRGIQEPGQMTIELRVPELGVIPASTTQRSLVAGLLGKSEPQDRLELTTWQHWPSAFSESFRFALTSILLSGENEEQPRVIALSSANPAEGKSSVISNLAIALARTNRRVLLIDGDMRKPRLHEIFKADNRVGLSDILAGNPLAAIPATKIPNLFLLPSGRSADEKLLFTPHFRQLLQRLRAEFDMVLIDTPPLLGISDARLISHLADAVILVVAQHTDRDAVRLAQQRLAEDGSFLLGTILNKWDPKTSSNRYGYYSDCYKRYYAKRSGYLSAGKG